MSTMSSSQACFRSMVRSDLPAVLAIEKRSFRQPWEREQFLEAMTGKGGTRAYVLESNARLIGYYVLENQGRNIHLLNLAIHPDHRRRGHASRILAKVDQICLGANGDPAQAAVRGAEREKAEVREGEPAFPPRSPRGDGDVPPRSPRGDGDVPPRSPRGDEAGEPIGEIYLEVEETNLPAQLLYKKMGYRATKVLRNHYPALHEDGYKMVRKLYSTLTGTSA